MFRSSSAVTYLYKALQSLGGGIFAEGARVSGCVGVHHYDVIVANDLQETTDFHTWTNRRASKGLVAEKVAFADLLRNLKQEDNKYRVLVIESANIWREVTKWVRGGETPYVHMDISEVASAYYEAVTGEGYVKPFEDDWMGWVWLVDLDPSDPSVPAILLIACPQHGWANFSPPLGAQPQDGTTTNRLDQVKGANPMPTAWPR